MTAEPTSDEPGDAKKKSPLVAIVAGVLAFAGAGGGAYVIAPQFLAGAAASSTADGDSSAHADAKDKKKKSKESHGAEPDTSGDADAGAAKFIVRGEAGLFLPAPIVVSIRPNDRFRHLKIGFAVETSADSGAAFEENELRIRDALNAYLRAVEPQTLNDADSFGRLRAQIARRIAFVVAPAPVHGVMITDFILS